MIWQNKIWLNCFFLWELFYKMNLNSFLIWKCPFLRCFAIVIFYSYDRSQNINKFHCATHKISLQLTFTIEQGEGKMYMCIKLFWLQLDHIYVCISLPCIILMQYTEKQTSTNNMTDSCLFVSFFFSFWHIYLQFLWGLENWICDHMYESFTRRFRRDGMIFK